MFYQITLEEIKRLQKEKQTKGILIIVDGEHLHYKTAKTALPVLNSVLIDARGVFKNYNGQLVFDFDGTRW